MVSLLLLLLLVLVQVSLLLLLLLLLWMIMLVLLTCSFMASNRRAVDVVFCFVLPLRQDDKSKT